MIEWLKRLFSQDVPKSHNAYQVLVGAAREFDSLSDHALTLFSNEQVQATQEIDDLIAEMTKRKQQIVVSAKKADHVMTMRAHLKRALDVVEDALDGDDGAAV